MKLEKTLVNLWYQPLPLWLKPLIPFCTLFECFTAIRREYLTFKQRWLPSLSTPIVVIGNLSVGGTGKTPLVRHIAELCLANGLKPGVVTRGYRGYVKGPLLVSANSHPAQVGDEAIWLADILPCPVMVAKKRYKGVKALVQDHGVDVVISDDGLQHYALPRDIEIAVIDGERRFGNGYCLPLGPLREGEDRLNEVDYVVVNGVTHSPHEYSMHMVGDSVFPLEAPQQTVPLSTFKNQTVHAICGLGNPMRFIKHLESNDITVDAHCFSDHQDFTLDNILFNDEAPVLMTAKDAVKIKHFLPALLSQQKTQYYVVPVKTHISEEFDDALLSQLRELVNEQ